MKQRVLKFKAWDGNQFLLIDEDPDYIFMDQGEGLKLWSNGNPGEK